MFTLLICWEFVAKPVDWVDDSLLASARIPPLPNLQDLLFFVNVKLLAPNV